MEIDIVTSINKITKEEYPELWDMIIDDPNISDREHRKSSTFYVTPRYNVDDWHEGVPKELHGTWEADTCTWSDDWGLDHEPDTLYRVESKEEIVTTTKQVWKRVV